MTLFAPAVALLRGPRKVLAEPIVTVTQFNSPPVKREPVSTLQAVESEVSVAIRAYLLMRHDPQGIYAAEPTNMLRALMPFDHDVLEQRLKDHIINQVASRADVRNFLKELQPLMDTEGMTVLGLLAYNSVERRIDFMHHFEFDDSMVINGAEVRISALLGSVCHMFEFLDVVENQSYDERVYAIYAPTVFEHVDIISVIQLMLRHFG